MRLRHAAAVITAGALFASCGDDGGGSTGGVLPPLPEPPPVSKAEFVKEADKVCTKAQAKFVEAGPPPIGAAAEQAKHTQGLIKITETQIRQLRALTPPPGDEAIINRFLDTFEETVGVLKKVRKALQQGDQTKANDLFLKGQDVGERVQTIAQKYKFKVCGAG
jgi:hypothetical protein